MAQDEVNKLLERTNPSTVHLDRVLGKEIRDQVGKANYKREVSFPTSSLEGNIKILKSIALKDQEDRKNNDLGIKIIKINGEALIKAPIALGLTLAPETSGASAIIGGLVSYSADQGLGKVVSMAEEANREAVRRNLKTNLEKYRTVTSQSELERLMKVRDTKRFKEQLEAKIGIILADKLKDIPAEDQDIVNNFYTKVIAETMKDGFNSLNEVNTLQQSQLDQNESDIIGLSAVFANYEKVNQEQLNDILQQQSIIQEGLEDLNKRSAQDEAAFEFIQEYMFGKMTSEEQLNALKMGLFNGLEDQERMQLIAEIELVKKKEDLNRTIRNYLGNAGELVSIARKFGVSEDILRPIDAVVTTSASAFNAFNAFASGNYLGALSSIGDIFGLGGRDIAAERHQEIMNALMGIDGKLNLLNDKIDSLLKGQIVIIKNQGVLFEAIEQLNHQIVANHNQIIDKLQKLSGDIIYNRGLVVADILGDYALCDELVISLPKGDTLIDTERKKYPTLKEFRRLHRKSGTAFVSCTERMQRIREISVAGGEENNFSKIFYLRTHDNENRDQANYIDSVYNPLVSLLRNSQTFLSMDKNLAYSSLLAPTYRCDDIDLKMNNLENGFRPRFRSTFENLFENVLHPEMVKVHCDYALNIHFYFQLLDDDNRPASLEHLIGTNDVKETGESVLFNALNLVDISIGQLNLTSGDIVLPILERIFNNIQATDSSDYFKAISALRYNSILSKNFLTYKLSKEIKEKKSNIKLYDIALKDTTGFLLRKITSFNWNYQWNGSEVKRNAKIIKPKGWSVKLGNKYVPLPTSDDLLEKRIAYQTDLYTMLKLRKRIIDEISTYEVYKRIPSGDRKIFNTAILNDF